VVTPNVIRHAAGISEIGNGKKNMPAARRITGATTTFTSLQKAKEKQRIGSMKRVHSIPLAEAHDRTIVVRVGKRDCVVAPNVMRKRHTERTY